MDIPSRHQSRAAFTSAPRQIHQQAVPPWENASSSPSSYHSHASSSSVNSRGGFDYSSSHHLRTPLPSPSSSQPKQSFLGSSNPTKGGPAGRGPTSAPPGTSSTASSARTTRQADSESYDGHPSGGDPGRSSTNALLQDFGLVAEAAKRAQMAVLMRDMEGVAL